MGDVKEKIRRLAEEAAGGLALEVVDVEVKRGKRRTLLRVYIERPEGGVTLGDCEAMSRALEPLLYAEDPIEGPYTMEVSSPGLDRPLRGLEDFRRHIGKLARVVTKKEAGGKSFFIGRIVDVGEDYVILNESGMELFIKHEDISRARLEIEI